MKFLLSTLNNLKYINSNINRASVSYPESKHIGILYTYIDENKQKAINKFVESLKKDGKRVDLLPAISKKNADNRYFKTFKINEISSLGSWSNNNVNLFIFQEYDFLIYPDLSIIPEMENIIIRSYSRCRVSFIHTQKNLFELILKSKAEFDIDLRLNTLHKYLKKIH